jgi:hypothetical protein
MKDKDNDLLSDLEADLTGDWKKIQEDIQDKEHEEWVKNNPQRWNLPSFREFYHIMLRLFREGFSHDNHLHRLLVGIFHNHRNEDPMPKAFDNIWSIFCDPHRYSCATGVACRNCRSRWDVMYEKDRMYHRPLRVGDFRDMHMQHTLREERVSCPRCGHGLLNITSSFLPGGKNFKKCW